MLSLSKKERLQLYLQYTILDKLDPGNGWGHLAEIVQDGYTSYYSRLTDHIGDEFDIEMCRFVEDVLSMFDGLQWPYIQKGIPVPSELKFIGFDGNNETDLMAYARFLRRDRRWESLEVFDNCNSHFPMREAYARMLPVWRAAGSPSEVGKELAENILAARVHPSHLD
ncbi:YfbU family protein [Xanthobacter flavus]|uniref:YfbU family protein n=1 Tax=Xanthobacter flavus TaxID=281 RepID=UPI003728F813